MRRRFAIPGLLLLIVGLGAAYVWRLQHTHRPMPTDERLQALRQQRDALRDRFRELTSGGFAQGLDEGPQAGLLIVIPTSFTRALVEKLVTGLFGEVRLQLRDLRVRRQDDVKGKVLFTTQTVGRFELEVEIPEVNGRLRTLRPSVGFAQQRVTVGLPVRLADGQGRAVIHLKWDSRGLASAVCGDFETTAEVFGSLQPRDYQFDGSFGLAAAGGEVVLTPRFGQVRVELLIEPSEEAWKAVDDVIDERKALCRFALARADARARLKGLVARGFWVTLPDKLFRTIRLPAGVQQSLELQGVRLALDLKPVDLRVTEKRIWYGVNVETRRANAAGRP